MEHFDLSVEGKMAGIFADHQFGKKAGIGIALYQGERGKEGL
jgi:hypothetical protein